MTVQSMSAGQSPVQQMKQADVVVEFHDGYGPRERAVRPPGLRSWSPWSPPRSRRSRNSTRRPLPESDGAQRGQGGRDVFFEKAESFVKSPSGEPADDGVVSRPLHHRAGTQARQGGGRGVGRSIHQDGPNVGIARRLSRPASTSSRGSLRTITFRRPLSIRSTSHSRPIDRGNDSRSGGRCWSR